MNPVVILLPFLLTPIVSFLFRMVNATIAPDLIDEFGLGPAALGVITSAFLVGFGAAQLPMGVLLDRYGPRPVVIGLQTIGATGAVVFVSADSGLGLLFGRFLIGVGMAGSVMAGLKAANLWFDRARLPAIGAMLFGMTGVGGMLATGPLGYLLETVAWRDAVLGAGGFCACIALIAAVAIPKAPPPADRETLRSQVRALGRIFRSAPFLRFAPLTFTIVGAYSSYQSLWAGIWLRDMEGYDRAEMSWALFALMVAMTAGNFAMAAANAWLVRQGISTLKVAMTAMAAMILVQTVIASGLTDASLPFWFALCFFSSGPIAIFALLSARFPPELAGRCNTALNLMGFIGGFLIQSGIGLTLGLFPVAADGGYAPEGHRTALWALVAIQACAFAWFFFAGRFDRPADTSDGSDARS